MNIPGKTLRCLIVEDVEDDAQLMLRQLRTDGHDVTWERVDTPEAMRAALQRQPWDLVLSDYRMPRFSGLAAFEVLRASGLDLPFIIVSGTIGEETAVAAMKAGVDDYLIKGQLDHLSVAVERELRNAATRRERAAVAAALQKTQALLTQTEALGKIGGWEFDVETKQQTWTEAVYAIHELDRSVHPTVELGVNFYTPESQPIIAQAVQRAIELGEPFDVELEIITAKGHRRSIHAVGQTDPARRKVSGFIHDITERKQAEAVRRASEERHRTILQTAQEGFWLVDASGRLVEVNEAYIRMSGYSGEELLGMGIPDLEAAETAAAAAEHMQRIMRQGSDRFETKHRRKDGSVFDLEINVQVQSGEGRGFVCFLHDITKRKQAEAARRLHAEELRLRNETLTRFNTAAVGRELRMIELKREVNALCAQLGEPPRHRVADPAPAPEDTP